MAYAYGKRLRPVAFYTTGQHPDRTGGRIHAPGYS